MNLLRNIYQLIGDTFSRMQEINIGLHGAAIAFYAIFSTAPLLVILLWVAGAVLGGAIGQAELRETLLEILGAPLADTVTALVASTAKGGTGFWSSMTAVAMLLFGATTLLTQLKHTLNLVWGLEDPGIGTVWQFLWDRLVGLLFIGILSILFLVGLISESLMYGLEYYLVAFLGSENLMFWQWINSVANIGLAFLFFAAMFRLLPDIIVRWRDIAVGSAVTTLLVLTGKALVDWYLGMAALQPVYKVAGSFVIFLIWMYYNIQVVLVGAVFTRVFTSRFGGEIQPYWRAEGEEEDITC